ncbi:MAG: pirin family protein [Bdellovibrionales bacterium]
MQIRRSNERGHFENDWLNSFHTFSFADYFDRQHMHFHDLRVINEDVVQPSAGFPTHGHRDMEIITYVVEGAVAHKDSMGNAEQIKAGEVQVMSAGRGVLHSEFNPDAKKPLKLLQIWVLPNREGLAPTYQQREFSRVSKTNKLCLVAAPNGGDGALRINQDVRLYASILETNQRLVFPVQNKRAVWLQMVRGQLEINGQIIGDGDGVAIEESGELRLSAKQESEFLLFDLVKI